jgi:hypothetical protein
MEVMGIRSLKLSLSILISPGKLPNQLKFIGRVVIRKPKKAIIKPI